MSTPIWQKHQLQAKAFRTPHRCGVCRDTMWGMMGRGFKCADCTFVCHATCVTKALDLGCDARVRSDGEGGKPGVQGNVMGPFPPAGATRSPLMTDEPLLSPSSIKLPREAGQVLRATRSFSTLSLSSSSKSPTVQPTDYSSRKEYSPIGVQKDDEYGVQITHSTSLGAADTLAGGTDSKDPASTNRQRRASIGDLFNFRPAVELSVSPSANTSTLVSPVLEHGPAMAFPEPSTSRLSSPVGRPAKRSARPASVADFSDLLMEFVREAAPKGGAKRADAVEKKSVDGGKAADVGAQAKTADAHIAQAFKVSSDFRSSLRAVIPGKQLGLNKELPAALVEYSRRVGPLRQLATCAVATVTWEDPVWTVGVAVVLVWIILRPQLIFVLPQMLILTIIRSNWVSMQRALADADVNARATPAPPPARTMFRKDGKASKSSPDLLSDPQLLPPLPNKSKSPSPSRGTKAKKTTPPGADSTPVVANKKQNFVDTYLISSSAKKHHLPVEVGEEFELSAGEMENNYRFIQNWLTHSCVTHESTRHSWRYVDWSDRWLTWRVACGTAASMPVTAVVVYMVPWVLQFIGVAAVSGVLVVGHPQGDNILWAASLLPAMAGRAVSRLWNSSGRQAAKVAQD